MKQLYKQNKRNWPLILLVMMVFASCKVERLSPVAESTKDISGDWTVIAATRNGTDLMSTIDFSQFKVSFKDGKYTLINRLPFLVSKDGSYSFDDPQYPFKISFTATGSPAVATAFTYPIVNGIRQLTLTFSPGCPGNTYVYTFKKAN